MRTADGEVQENYIGDGKVPASMLSKCETSGDTGPGDAQLACEILEAQASGELNPGPYTDSQLQAELGELTPAEEAALEAGN